MMTTRLSPLHNVHQTAGLPHHEAAGWLIAAPADQADAPVQIYDCSHDSNLLVEGAGAAALIRAVLGTAPASIGSVVTGKQADIGQLTATKFYLRADAGHDAGLVAQLQTAAAGSHVTVTNQTEGTGGLLLAGPHAATVMSMLCGLDFSASAFPAGSLRVSSFGKVRASIWRTPSLFRVYAGRSYLVYLDKVVRQAREMIE